MADINGESDPHIRCDMFRIKFRPNNKKARGHQAPRHEHAYQADNRCIIYLKMYFILPFHWYNVVIALCL